MKGFVLCIELVTRQLIPIRSADDGRRGGDDRLLLVATVGHCDFKALAFVPAQVRDAVLHQIIVIIHAKVDLVECPAVLKLLLHHPHRHLVGREKRDLLPTAVDAAVELRDAFAGIILLNLLAVPNRRAHRDQVVLLCFDIYGDVIIAAHFLYALGNIGSPFCEDEDLHLA